MFTAILPQQTQKTVELLGSSNVLAHFYLSGGTACALHVGHRLSEDLDFFTQNTFNAQKLRNELLEFGKVELLAEDKNTLHCVFNKTRLSFLRYAYPLLEPNALYKSVNISSLIDVLCTKLDTISARGSKKDFIDVYCAVSQGYYALSDIISAFQKKYKDIDYSLLHLMKGLVYFEDADAEHMPVMKIALDWEKVKSFFKDEVKKAALSQANKKEVVLIIT